MRSITVGLFALFLVLPACKSEGEPTQEKPSATVTQEQTAAAIAQKKAAAAILQERIAAASTQEKTAAAIEREKAVAAMLKEMGSGPSGETLTLAGKVYCGAIRACTGESFLVYMDDWGGKVIFVTPTARRSPADVRRSLADGVRVEIAGIEKSRLLNHHHTVSADQITFLPRKD